MGAAPQRGESLFVPPEEPGDHPLAPPRRDSREPGSTAQPGVPASFPPVGERLKHARERQGLPLGEISRILKIPLKSLEALEEGVHEALPADVYARGFVKAYAEYLGADAVQAVRDFTAERARGLPATERASGSALLRPLSRPRRLVFHPRTTAIASGALLGLAALAYLFIEVRGFTRAPFLDVTDPSENVEIQGNTVVVRGRADPTAEVRINGERTFVKNDGTFEETLGISEGVNAVRVTAMSVGGKEQAITRHILVRLPPAPPVSAALRAAPAPPRSASPGDPVRLTVQAEGEPVWALLRVDGRAVFSGLLLPGSRQEAVGRRIEVTSGKGNRTRIAIDGQDRGFLSENPGVVRDITFTRVSPSGTVERQ